MRRPSGPFLRVLLLPPFCPSILEPHLEQRFNRPELKDILFHTLFLMVYALEWSG